jgi:hypothetical protein
MSFIAIAFIAATAGLLIANAIEVLRRGFGHPFADRT